MTKPEKTKVVPPPREGRYGEDPDPDMVDGEVENRWWKKTKTRDPRNLEEE